MGRNFLRRFAAVITKGCFTFVVLSLGTSNLSALGDSTAQALSNTLNLAQVSVKDVSRALPLAQTLELEPVYGIDFRNEPELLQQLQYLRQPGSLVWLQEVYRRGRSYRSFIFDAIERRKMPRELAYVALVESEFLPEAFSRSGAAGMWQFMLNSIGESLKHDIWVDERFDFWNATNAALEKLAYNYKVLGDWPLALAAYNAGLGRVTRLRQAHGRLSFWELSRRSLLPAETRLYVPRILAIAYLLETATRNGILVSWQTATRWAKVRIKPGVSLSELSKQAGLPERYLSDLNPELRFGIAPPYGWSIKVPSALAQRVALEAKR